MTIFTKMAFHQFNKYSEELEEPNTSNHEQFQKTEFNSGILGGLYPDQFVKLKKIFKSMVLFPTKKVLVLTLDPKKFTSVEANNICEIKIVDWTKDNVTSNDNLPTPIHKLSTPIHNSDAIIGLAKSDIVPGLGDILKEAEEEFEQKKIEISNLFKANLYYSDDQTGAWDEILSKTDDNITRAEKMYILLDLNRYKDGKTKIDINGDTADGLKKALIELGTTVAFWASDILGTSLPATFLKSIIVSGAAYFGGKQIDANEKKRNYTVDEVIFIHACLTKIFENEKETRVYKSVISANQSIEKAKRMQEEQLKEKKEFYKAIEEQAEEHVQHNGPKKTDLKTIAEKQKQKLLEENSEDNASLLRYYLW